MSNGFERRKEQSKENIRRAAWELFGQFGVERVSITDIARKAGVSQATIYNNFGSKEALAHEFVTGVVDRLVARAGDALAVDRPYGEKMAAFVQLIAAIMTHDRPAEGDATLFGSSADLQRDPEIRKIRDAAREKMAGLLLEVVKEGQGQGQVAPDLAEDALRVYFGAFMDIFTDPQLQHRFYTSPKIVQDLGWLMMYGLSRPR